MDISLRHLEIFIAIAKYKSIVKASEKLYLSQSAISMALSELENKLGVKLFDRVGRRLVLNTYGEKLFIEATEIIERIEEIKKNFSKKEVLGKIIIGGTQTIGNYVLPEIIANFKKNYENVEIFLEIGNTEKIVEKLLNFEIDVAFVEGIVMNNNLESIKWIDDEIVVFTNINDKILKKKKVTIKDLEKAKWILREKGSGTREIFEKTIFSKVKNFNIYLEANQIKAIKKLVASGAGWGALSKKTLIDDIEFNKLKILNLPFKIKREFKILIHKKKYRTEILKKFLEFAKCF